MRVCLNYEHRWQPVLYWPTITPTLLLCSHEDSSGSEAGVDAGHDAMDREVDGPAPRRLPAKEDARDNLDAEVWLPWGRFYTVITSVRGGGGTSELVLDAFSKRFLR